MFKYIKESFQNTNKYIILATPLIFFSLISSLYLLFSVGGNLISLIFACLLLVLMLSAFIAGWCYMIKLCTENKNDEDYIFILKEFTSGVGEYFLSILGALCVVFVITLILVGLTHFIGLKLIGPINIPLANVSETMTSPAALKGYLMSLPEEQLIKLSAWELLLMATMAIEYFLIMFYMPVIFFKTKNPFKALWTTLKDTFSKQFLSNVFLYLILAVSYVILSVLTTIVR